ENATADRLPLPLRTDWSSTATDLAAKALRLGRLRAWLTLIAPPEGQAGPFPYHLAFQEAGKGFLTTNQTKGGQRYKMVLRADEDELRQGVADRWVYVFSVD